MNDSPAAECVLHATCVAAGGRGLLVLGQSGAGKSSLAIRLIALGASLVADDRVMIRSEGGVLVARCPNPDLAGVIEARGIGLLNAPAVSEVKLALALDLDQSEGERLPPERELPLLGLTLPLVLHPQNDHLAESLLLCLVHGWRDARR